MAVQTGISPRELERLDAESWDALVRAANSERERWTSELELAAATVEILHAQLLAFTRVNAKKGAQLPAQVHIPRPDEQERKRERPPRVSIAELVQHAGESVEVIHGG